MESAGDARDARPRVLLCWGYHRSGWVRPFEELSDAFDFHYLFHVSPEHEDGVKVSAPRHYWSQFTSGADVLDGIRPDRIVFMGLDGAWSIALNHVARERRVPTYVMQHGTLETSPARVAAPSIALSVQASSVPAVRFLLRSFGRRNVIEWWPAMAFMLDSRRRGARTAMHEHKFPGRTANYYIAFTPEEAEFFIERDGAPATHVAPVGLPEHDALFRALRRPVDTAGPIVLIDSPTAGNRWGQTTTTETEKAMFLRHLAHTAASMGKPLLVKLHPETYEADWLPDEANTEYVREVDVGELVASASICIGFDSTLMIPAVCGRPTVLLEGQPHRISRVAHATGAAPVVRPEELTRDAFEDAIARFNQNAAERAAFGRRLAHRTDGRALQRLADALSGPREFMAANSLASQVYS